MARRKPALNGTTCIEKTGLDALKQADRNKLELDGLEILNSVDIDACFKSIEPNSNRWDYYLGIKRHGELYFEVHEVSDTEYQKLLDKAVWLRNKITTMKWPETPERPLVVAPTKGITPFSAYGVLSKRLALQKIAVVMKGDRISDLLD